MTRSFSLLTLVPWLAAGACSSAPPAPRPPAATTEAPVASASASASASVSVVTSGAPSVSVSMSAASALPESETPALPAGFVAVADEGQTRCGELLVERPSEPGGERGQRFVRVVRRDGSRVYEAHGQRFQLDAQSPAQRQWMTVEFCGDLTGDGVPELVLTESTMGAHCCYTHHVVSLTTPTRRLMTWEKGDMGTPLVPVRHRPDGPWQIEGKVVMWPPFDVNRGDPVISYAGAPIVPVVLALHQGEYKLMSLAFPEVYRRQRDAVHARCASDASCFGEIIAWLDSLAIGDWETEKTRPLYQDYLPSFERLSAGMKRTMEQGLGTERAPRRLSPLR